MAKKSFFALYGTWEGLIWGKILPRGVGTICPYFWEIIFFAKIEKCKLFFLSASFGFWRCVQHAAGAFFRWKSTFLVFLTCTSDKMCQNVSNCGKSIIRQCWNSGKPIAPSPDSAGTVQNQLFHHQTVLEQFKSTCSITGQCWNSSNPPVPS